MVRMEALPMDEKTIVTRGDLARILEGESGDKTTLSPRLFTGDLAQGVNDWCSYHLTPRDIVLILHVFDCEFVKATDVFFLSKHGYGWARIKNFETVQPATVV